MLYRAVAYQVADSIELKTFRAAFPEAAHTFDKDEIFYALQEDRYIYVFKYGVVCFLNFDEIKVAEFNQFIAPFCRNQIEVKLQEELVVETGAREFRFGFDKIDILTGDLETFRIIMLNVSQSVALDYYSSQTTILLEETNHHTQNLEKTGKLGMSGISLKKYIGRTLNLKNKIAENLYIFDSPDVTWENENLNKVDLALKNTFDLQDRFRTVHDGLEIVKENLDLFKDLMQHRKSTALEWIIIILILVEVVNLAVEKIFKL
jgi:uncharacterized Rmd1/YagE family protein